MGGEGLEGMEGRGANDKRGRHREKSSEGETARIDDGEQSDGEQSDEEQSSLR